MVEQRAMANGGGIPLVVIAVLAVAVWSVFKSYTGVVDEDALITFRYAENMAEGRGLVYNDGEQVLGTTTPLLALILGVAGAVGGRAAVAATVFPLMAAAGILLLLTTYGILRRCQVGNAAALMACVLVLLQPHILMAIAGGMEMPLVLGLMGGSALLLLEKRQCLAGCLCGLLLLARIDGVIWMGLLMAWALIESRDWRPVARVAVGSAVVVLPWCVFSVGYFGNVLPHTLFAKRTIGNVDSLGSLWAFARLKGYAKWFIQNTPLSGGTLEILLFVAGIFGAACRGGRSFLWVFVFFAILAPAAYYVGKAPHVERYLVPIGVCLSILMAVGIDQILETVSRGSRHPMHGRCRYGIGVVLLLLLLVPLIRKDILCSAAVRRRQEVQETGLRQVVGEWLRAHTPQDAVIAMEAIGYQGYYSRRTIIDLGGLVTPAMVEIRKQSSCNAEAFRTMLETLAPDYIVLRSFEVDENRHFHGGPLFQSANDREFFGSRYEEIKRFASPIEYGPLSRLTIYGYRLRPPCGS